MQTQNEVICKKRRARLIYKDLKSPNKLKRVSVNFENQIKEINELREEKGDDSLSWPLMTELIISHNSTWPEVKEDIINYNTALLKQEEEEDDEKDDDEE